MTGQRYQLRKVGVLSLAKFGAVLGSVAMVWPSLICALGSVQAIGGLRRLLERWQSSQVDAAGVGIPVEFDFVNLLGLETVQTLINRLDEQRTVVMLMIILGMMLVGALLIAGTILLLGWAYNLLATLTGGLELELRTPGDTHVH
jgi:hypothetical protein